VLDDDVMLGRNMSH